MKTRGQCNSAKKNVLFGGPRPPRPIGDQIVCRIVMKYGIALLHKTYSRNPEFRENCPCDNLTSNLQGGLLINRSIPWVSRTI